jgi:hypothetical protein
VLLFGAVAAAAVTAIPLVARTVDEIVQAVLYISLCVLGVAVLGFAALVVYERGRRVAREEPPRSLPAVERRAVAPRRVVPGIVVRDQEETRH